MDINETNLTELFVLRDIVEEVKFKIYKNDIEYIELYIELYTKYDQMITQTKLEMISL